MVNFCGEINSDVLSETIERLAKDVNLYPQQLASFLIDASIEDAYPDTIDFDPERSPESCSEYAEFKLLSRYTPEQMLITKKMVLLFCHGGGFDRELNIINNFILQGYTFSQIMNYLLDAVYLKPQYAVASELSMIGNTNRPHPNEIVRFLNS